MKFSPKFVATLLPLVLIATPLYAVTPKTGGSCSKAGATATSAGKKYTCIKSGKKLVWNKGVKVSTPKPVVTPTPSASATPTPTPTSTATPLDPNLPIINTSCPKVNVKVITSYGFLKCGWQGGATSTGVWREYRTPKISTSSSNNYKAKPVENGVCESSGDTFDIPSGILECRWVAGNKLRWIKIDSVKNTFTNAVSPRGIEPCMLKNADATVRTGRGEGLLAAFPFNNTNKHQMNTKGTNEVLIVAIDFPELPGDKDLKEKLASDVKWMKDWYRYFSNDQAKFNVTTIDYWIHSPRSAASYIVTGNDGNSADSNNFLGRAIQPFVDLITKEVDLRKFSTVYFMFPDGERSLDMALDTRNYYFTIKEGQKHLNFFGWGRDNEFLETLRWAYYVHETLHDFDLIVHAPGNGWPFGIGQNQSGISLAMNPYEQFLLDWLPKEQIYCVDANNLTKANVSLTPVEREDKQTKMAIIRVSATKLIVVESHGIDKWSNSGFGDRNFPTGFYSVMAYLVDLNNVYAPWVASDGRHTLDDGNDPRYPRWAMMQKVDRSSLNMFNFRFSGPALMDDYIAVLGDSFLIEGIRIKFVGTGDFETIEISKA